MIERNELIINPNLYNSDDIIEEDPELNTEIEFGTTFHKTFRSFKRGNLQHSIISLFSSSNLLALFLCPKFFSLGGICLASAILLTYYFISYHSHIILLKLIMRKPSKSYQELIQKYNANTSYVIYQIANFLYIIGLSFIYAYSSYIYLFNSIVKIYINKLVLYIISSPTPILVLENKESFLIFLGVIFSFMFLLQLPFSLIRNPSNMHLANITIVSFLIIIGIIMIIDTFIRHLEISINSFFFKSIDFTNVLIIALCSLGMSNHNTMFEQISNLKILSRKRGYILLSLTMLYELIALFIFGFIGAISKTGNHLVWMFSIESDTLVLLYNAVLGIGFTIQTGFFMIKLYDAIASIKRMNNNNNKSIGVIFMLNFFFLIMINLTLLLCIYYYENILLKAIIITLGFLGGICITVIQYIPIIIYNKNYEILFDEEKNQTTLNSIIMYVMIAMGIFVTVCSCFINESIFLPLSIIKDN